MKTARLGATVLLVCVGLLGACKVRSVTESATCCGQSAGAAGVENNRGTASGGSKGSPTSTTTGANAGKSTGGSTGTATGSTGTATGATAGTSTGTTTGSTAVPPLELTRPPVNDGYATDGDLQGYWYTRTDSDNGGKSEITPACPDPCFEDAGSSICASGVSAALPDPDSFDESRGAAVGWNLNQGKNGDPKAADLSAFTQVAVRVACDISVPLRVQLDVGAAPYPCAPLSCGSNTLSLRNDFLEECWDGGSRAPIDPSVLNEVTSIEIQIPAVLGDETPFDLCLRELAFGGDASEATGGAGGAGSGGTSGRGAATGDNGTGGTAPGSGGAGGAEAGGSEEGGTRTLPPPVEVEGIDTEASWTPLFAEDFEAGIDTWYAENGVWEVGAPGVGPADCHGGESCAGTVLDGEYPSGTDSRLVSPGITLPALDVDEELALRFYSWFQHGSYSSGQAQVSVWEEETSAWSAWTNVGPAVSGTGAVWAPKAGDLTAYAGQRIRLGFLHDVGNPGPGWYVDDVLVIRYVPTFTGDFNGGWSDWYAENGVWEVGTPTAGPGRCLAGDGCVGTTLGSDYPSGTDSRLVSPTVALPKLAAGKEVQLRFWNWFQHGSYSSGSVQVSTWDAETSTWSAWTAVGAGVSGSSGAWSRKAADLTPYAGQRARIGFLHDVGNPGAGWFLDA
ncbi:MAG: choice-of-anchor J domain-containing protein, partial [Polyangiaceae bacterium]|nr:choice-of-anchor J domain-containing protein [Polyangiaceae bacterium]